MSALVYLVKCKIINFFKALLKRPVLLVFYLLFIGLMVFSFAISFDEVGTGETRFGAFYPTALSGIGLLLLFSAISRGEKKGSGFFSMPDVHLLFTSPIKSSTVLLYGTLMQMTALLLVCVVMLFQITTLRLLFGLTLGGIFALIGSLAVTLFSTQCFSMLYYSFLSQNETRRTWGKRISMGVLLLLATLLAVIYLQTRDLMQTLGTLTNVIQWIPLGGWFAMASLAAQQNAWMTFWLVSGLQLVAGAAMMLLLIRIQPDYYEDVLDTAQKHQHAVELKKSGKMQQNAVLRNVDRIPFVGKGAFAIFGRHLISYVRQGFFDTGTIALIVISILWPLLSTELISGSVPDMRSTAMFVGYMMLFFSMQSPWAQEMKKPYIYLIPDTPGRKMIAATLMDIVKSFIDGIISAILAVIITGAPFYQVPLFALTIASFSAIYTAGDILARRLLGQTHAKGLGTILTFGLMIVCIVPSIVLLLVFPAWIGYLACAGLNFFISTIILLLCDSLFARVGFETDK